MFRTESLHDFVFPALQAFDQRPSIRLVGSKFIRPCVSIAEASQSHNGKASTLKCSRILTRAGQGIDEHHAIINQSGVKTYVSDHLGTVVNSEVTSEHKVTGAYGEILGVKSKISKAQNPVLYGYTGRQYDTESGFYYYRARSYDSSSGRFMSKDPKGIGSGDLNLYRYVSNQPMSAIDPMGENAYFYLGAVVVGAIIGYQLQGLKESQNNAEVVKTGIDSAQSLDPVSATNTVFGEAVQSIERNQPSYEAPGQTREEFRGENYNNLYNEYNIRKETPCP